MNKQLLIIGMPYSSKTVFLIQFYSRLQKRKSKMILEKTVGNLTPIISGREALANGQEPESTIGRKSEKMLFSIRLDDKIIELMCPEYGGEQIDSVLSLREVNTNWKEAIINSNNWLYFIRLNSVSHSLDASKMILTKKDLKTNKDTLESEYVISDQSAFIELLQIFLDLKGNDYHFKNKLLKLTVVLTCWDELETQNTPREVLKDKLPMFLNFIEANWEVEKLKILGLSAQGFSLNTDENKEKYQIDGPEEYGYVIKQDGMKTNDITELIIEAL